MLYSRFLLILTSDVLFSFVFGLSFNMSLNTLSEVRMKTLGINQAMLLHGFE